MRRLAPAILLALTACSTPAPEGNLTGSGIGGPFSLTAGDGHRVTDADFAGRWRLIYFGYTFCPDVCPVDMQQLALGVGAFAKAHPADAAKVAPIFISVDPERDTPAAVKQFAAAFGPGITGLTGTRAEIDPVLKEYRIAATKEGSGPNYMISHTVMAYLFDPRGRPVEFVAPVKAADVTAALEKFVR